MKFQKFLLPILITIGTVVVVVASGQSDRVKFPKGKIVITDGEKSLKLDVEIANTPTLRSIGLMYRKSIPDDFGMLFVLKRTLARVSG